MRKTDWLEMSLKSRSHSTFYPSRVCLPDDRLSAVAQRRRKNIKPGQYDTRCVVLAASRSSGGSPEKSDLKQGHRMMKNNEAINSEDTFGQRLKKLDGVGAARPINHSSLAISDNCGQSQEVRRAPAGFKLSFKWPNPSRTAVSH